jgi:uncharacterized protein (TIGR02757 family)
MDNLKGFLEHSYSTFNRPEFIDPDPLLVAREFASVEDREIAALVASCLAVGSAPLIVKASRDIISRMENQPRAFLESAGTDRKRGGGKKGGAYADLASAFRGFKYRFFTGDDIASLLFGVREVLGTRGTLGGAFSSCMKSGDETVLGALEGFIGEIVRARGAHDFAKNLLPSPEGKSACKRPLLFLRWMVRSDAVDPGGWDRSLTSALVQPMDTHMTWVAERFCFIPGGRPANLKTAIEVTRRFRELNEADPVKYDFCLTRPGIHPELSREDWFCGLNARSGNR